MPDYFKINDNGGLFTTNLPPFDDADWPLIVAPTGYIWLCRPRIDFKNHLESVVSSLFFNTSDLDVKCSINRLELDISIPAVEFLRFASTRFRHGIEFIHSEKHKPSKLQLNTIPIANWANVMRNNQIRFVFHRPDGGEPSLLTSTSPDVLISIADRFAGPNLDQNLDGQ